MTSRMLLGTALGVCMLIGTARAENSLMNAVMNEDLDTVRQQLRTGADVNVVIGDGVTPLMIAGGTNNLELVQLLLSSGARVNARHKNGATALHTAAESGNLVIVQAMLRAGATIDATFADGSTPLILACMGRHAGVARILVEAGADLTAKVDETMTALHFAEAAGDDSLAAYLRGRGAWTRPARALRTQTADSTGYVAVVVDESCFLSNHELESEFGLVPDREWGRGTIRSITETLSAVGLPGILSCEGGGGVRLSPGTPISFSPDAAARSFVGHFHLCNLEIDGCITQSAHGIVISQGSTLRHTREK